MAFTGQPLAATLDPCQICFEPSAYGDSEGTQTRVNAVFRPCESVAAELARVDEWLLQLAVAQSSSWFGRAKTLEQLRENYTPILKETEKYGPQFRAKMNLAPPSQTKVWDVDKAPRAAPEAWKGATVRPRLQLRGLYFMGPSQFGAIVEATDLQVLEESSSSCPF